VKYLKFGTKQLRTFAEKNNDYKRKAVEIWKSGKKAHYSLSTVQHRFKKVKFLPQLYQWKLSLQKGGTHREKLLYISEYWKNSEMLTTITKLFMI